MAVWLVLRLPFCTRKQGALCHLSLHVLKSAYFSQRLRETVISIYRSGDTGNVSEKYALLIAKLVQKI